MIVSLPRFKPIKTGIGLLCDGLKVVPRWSLKRVVPTMVLGAFLLTGIQGCDGKALEQAKSLKGERTEELRDDVRQDPGRHRLLVFVHGFNSGKDTAWGEFPRLIMNDSAFDDFNIHLFGYPTKGCRQADGIQERGAHLASFLQSVFTNTQWKYSQVVLVGHSMGGLVILEALLNMERDHLQLLREQDLKVLTFGTPYLGVLNTEVLTLFCDNRQVQDMEALNNKLHELKQNWTQRFNQSATDGRDTPQVPLYSFHGTLDRFVNMTSACGMSGKIPCVAVDGDHVSLVKPNSRSLLAYQKLHQLTTESTNQRSLAPPLQVMSVTIDEERSSFLMKDDDQSIHGLGGEDIVRKSIEFDRSMYATFRNAKCRSIEGEVPIENALPVWRDILKKRGRPDLVKRLKDYDGYRKLISSGSNLYLDARPTAAELVELSKHKPEWYEIIMRWTVECVGIADPVLIWTLRNNSAKDMVLTAVDYDVLDVGEVMGGIPDTLEPIDIFPHDLHHKKGMQTRKISPQIVLQPGTTKAIRIRYRMEPGLGFTWIVKPTFRTLENISADGPEIKIISGKGK
jgi:hypothetical protein